jgi:hypothetical protein
VIVEVLVESGFLVTGLLLGRFLPSRSSKPTMESPRCCQHPFGQHDPKTQACNAEIHRHKYSSTGAHVGNEYVSCPCLNYDGPRPLDSYYAPEIME